MSTYGKIPFQVDSSPTTTTYSVVCLVSFQFHTLTWRRTCKSYYGKLGVCILLFKNWHPKKQPKITVNPCKPPQKTPFFPGFWSCFPRKKQTFGVGQFSARNSARPWRLVVPRRVAYQHFQIASEEYVMSATVSHKIIQYTCSIFNLKHKWHLYTYHDTRQCLMNF